MHFGFMFNKFASFKFFHIAYLFLYKFKLNSLKEDTFNFIYFTDFPFSLLPSTPSFLTGSHHVAQAGLKLSIFLPPEFWD
jgi:hypothetical protein